MNYDDYVLGYLNPSSPVNDPEPVYEECTECGETFDVEELLYGHWGLVCTDCKNAEERYKNLIKEAKRRLKTIQTSTYYRMFAKNSERLAQIERYYLLIENLKNRYEKISICKS